MFGLYHKIRAIFNPLAARIFTIFGQIVTQKSMGREALRYPPHYPGP